MASWPVNGRTPRTRSDLAGDRGLFSFELVEIIHSEVPGVPPGVWRLPLQIDGRTVRLTHEIVTYEGANHASSTTPAPATTRPRPPRPYAKVLDWFGQHLG